MQIQDLLRFKNPDSQPNEVVESNADSKFVCIASEAANFQTKDYSVFLLVKRKVMKNLCDF